MGDLNPNGKIVFEHLLNYYLNNNRILKELQISAWWRNKKCKKIITTKEIKFFDLSRAISHRFRKIPIHWDGRTSIFYVKNFYKRLNLFCQ